MNQHLATLIDSGGFDWDNPRHREAYLKAWIAGTAPPPPRRPEPAEEPDA